MAIRSYRGWCAERRRRGRGRSGAPGALAGWREVADRASLGPIELEVLADALAA